VKYAGSCRVAMLHKHWRAEVEVPCRDRMPVAFQILELCFRKLYDTMLLHTKWVSRSNAYRSLG
jgi:hypothetical protein